MLAQVPVSYTFLQIWRFKFDWFTNRGLRPPHKSTDHSVAKEIIVFDVNLEREELVVVGGELCNGRLGDDPTLPSYEEANAANSHKRFGALVAVALVLAFVAFATFVGGADTTTAAGEYAAVIAP